MSLVQERRSRSTETSTRMKTRNRLSQHERKKSYKIGHRVDFYSFILVFLWHVPQVKYIARL